MDLEPAFWVRIPQKSSAQTPSLQIIRDSVRRPANVPRAEFHADERQTRDFGAPTIDLDTVDTHVESPKAVCRRRCLSHDAPRADPESSILPPKKTDSLERRSEKAKGARNQTQRVVGFTSKVEKDVVGIFDGWHARTN